MVKDRASIESFVFEAFQDRWSELQWGLKLKQFLKSETIDPVGFSGKFAHFKNAKYQSRFAFNVLDTIIRYATISEEPNKLMFSYLRYSISVQVVPHISFFESITHFHDLGKEHCVEKLLGISNDICNSIRLFYMK